MKLFLYSQDFIARNIYLHLINPYCLFAVFIKELIEQKVGKMFQAQLWGKYNFDHGL